MRGDTSYSIGDISYGVNVQITGLDEIKEKMSQINGLICDMEMLVQKLPLVKVDVSLEPKETGNVIRQGNG